METTAFQVLQLITSFIVPVILIAGFYISLRIDVSKNQVHIANFNKDLAEMKTDIKEIKIEIFKIHK